MSALPAPFRGDVWLEDGDVILVAQNVAFKVFQETLAEHSKLFSDLFSSFQSPTSQVPVLDGCPVVELSDTVPDLTNVLQALYIDPARYFTGTLSFCEISAMLRLGHKYGLVHIENEAVRRLRQCFPDNLEEFVCSSTISAICYREAEDSESNNPPPEFPNSSTTLCAKDSTAVINLARAYKLDFLLPAAFYVHAQQDSTFIIDSHVDGRSETWKLSEEDAKTALEVREDLKFASRRIFQWLYEPPQEGCLDPESCIAARHHTLSQMWHMLDQCDALLDGNRIYQESQGVLCHVCMGAVLEWHEEQRAVTWRALQMKFLQGHTNEELLLSSYMTPSSKY
ncbi:hypothetical protein EIP91_005105 [Steccherinum ochraceum]|uniref:BTB domain-containing protein n=1 Tax=Steccherinum ochraceum TaxID=92696 RepID=A0A4R0R7Q9_9APHY|nr:hypothetical protein EIP91_005105 [Steccherinum ochraceum]